MKINEVLKEGFYDNPSTSNATGQKYFIDSVTKQIHAYIDSVRKSKQPLQMWDFVNSYLTRYGWSPNPQQAEMLKKIAKEVEDEYNYFLQSQPKAQQAQQPTQPTQQNTGPTPQDLIAQKRAEKLKSAGKTAQSQMVPKMNEGVLDWAKAKAGTMVGSLASKMGLGSVSKLANAMYSVGMTQQRDPRTGKVIPSQAANQGGGGKPDDATVDPKGQQVINTVKTLKGEQYEKDLQEIVKLALWNLYGADKADYGDFVKQIMTQKSSAKNPQQTASIGGQKLNPNDPS